MPFRFAAWNEIMAKIRRRSWIVALLAVTGSVGLAQTTPNWVQLTPKTSPSPRYAFPVFDAAHGQVVMSEGVSVIGCSCTLTDTWVWDGTNWAQKSPQTSPPSISAAVYDAALNAVVAFDATLTPWVWDGSNWNQKSPQIKPPARDSYAIAYDAAHSQVLIFGGRDAQQNDFGDTWVWDGLNWTQMVPRSSPSARSGPRMVYDAAHTQVVMFGGLDTAASNLNNETWIWDGSAWTQKAPQDRPQSRWLAAMAYDSGHGEVVMFGGAPGALGFANDTWIWDGSNWTQQSPANSPSQRVTSMVYDSMHEQILLFGGYSAPNSNLVLGDTWARNSTPLPLASIKAASGDGQSGPAGLRLANPVVVTVFDTLGNPLLGANVSFTASNATVNTANAPTDSLGHASVQVTLGNNIGPATVTATAGALPPVTFGFTVTSPQPSIDSGGIVPIYSSASTIQPGSWVSIFGHNLVSGPSAVWNGNFPTSLGGTMVTINNRLAYLWFVSSTQINLQAPDDSATGPVSVVVTNTLGSATATVTLAPVAPSFNLLDTTHVAGIILRSDGSGHNGGGTYDILGPTGTSLGYATVAAQAGDTLELFGTGFGPTNPPVAAGMAYTSAAPATATIQLSINGMRMTPAFAGMTAAGQFQLNVTLPGGLGSGDVPLIATVNGVATPTGVVISLR